MRPSMNPRSSTMEANMDIGDLSTANPSGHLPSEDRSELFQRDQPAVGIRVLHLDLKGCAPTPTRLLELLSLIAAARYNALLVEWEDMFPWTVDERFRCPNAYTRSDVQRFHERAAELGIEVIPLVQSLGHLETVLSVPGYERLRETPNRRDVLHPLAEGAAALIRRMVDDVLEQMPARPRYFHLGGDEAWSFGQHPASAAYIQQHGKSGLFMHHMRPLLEHLREQHVRPLLWHDMLIEWDGASLRELAAQADVVAWGYGPPPDQTGMDHRLEVLERFHRHGLTLWGATAYKGPDGTTVNLPDMPTRINNAEGWMRLAHNLSLVGVVATGWSRSSTHRPQKAPIDSALDALVLVGLILHDGQSPPNAVSACRAWLNERPEGTPFRACYEAMRDLTQVTDRAWTYVRFLYEQAAFRHKRGDKIGQGEDRALLSTLEVHCNEVERAGNRMRQAFDTLMFPNAIEEYVFTRLLPLHTQLKALNG